jgi:hypothetical protein
MMMSIHTSCGWSVVVAVRETHRVRDVLAVDVVPHAFDGGLAAVAGVVPNPALFEVAADVTAASWPKDHHDDGETVS